MGRLVRQLTSQQVEAGYVGYVGSSVDDLYGLFEERRRFEEWLDQAMVDAAVLADQRDYYRSRASVVGKNRVRHLETDAASHRFPASNDLESMHGQGVAMV